MTQKTIFYLMLILLFLSLICACANDILAGSYSGTVPAADGPGINVQITLNADQTFNLMYDYIDRDSSFNWNGTFSFDKTDNIITLSQGNFQSFPTYYRLGKNQLLQLDRDGNEIKGQFADMYVLKKN